MLPKTNLSQLSSHGGYNLVFNKQTLAVFVLFYLLSIALFFADPFVPASIHLIKLILWIFLSLGTLFYKSTEFNTEGFITVLILNLVSSAYMTWIFNKFYSGFKKA